MMYLYEVGRVEVFWRVFDAIGSISITCMRFYLISVGRMCWGDGVVVGGLARFPTERVYGRIS